MAQPVSTSRIIRFSLGYAKLEISVARDRIVFSLGELTGNIWMAKLDLKWVDVAQAFQPAAGYWTFN